MQVEEGMEVRVADVGRVEVDGGVHFRPGTSADTFTSKESGPGLTRCRLDASKFWVHLNVGKGACSSSPVPRVGGVCGGSSVTPLKPLSKPLVPNPLLLLVSNFISECILLS